MKILLAHVKIYFIQLLRQASYVVSTLVFPSIFFLLFALPSADTKVKANLLMGSFAAFAVLGVVFLQFTVEIANEISNPWSCFVKTLPVHASVIWFSRALVALIFALLSSWVVIMVVCISSPASLTFVEFLNLNVILVIGAIPFCLLALLLGHWVPPQSALPIANLFYILLSFAGGLWMPPQALPEKLKKISDLLPTRAYGEWVWSAVTPNKFDLSYAWLLVGYSVTFGLLLIWRLSKKAS